MFSWQMSNASSAWHTRQLLRSAQRKQAHVAVHADTHAHTYTQIHVRTNGKQKCKKLAQGLVWLQSSVSDILDKITRW